MYEKPYKYITESSDIESVIPILWNHWDIAVDIETTGLDPRKDKLLTIQIATPDSTYVFNATKIDLTPLFISLLDFDGTVAIQNGKFDLQFLYHNFGHWWRGNFYDPFIAHRIKNIGIAKTYKDKFVGLDRLALGYLGYKLNKDIRESFQFSDGNLTDDQIRYAAEDAAILLPLKAAMEEKVLERQPKNILDMEFSLLPVTAMMEYYGIRINTELWGNIADEKATKRAEHAEKAKEIFSNFIDWNINLNSWQQLLKAFNEYMDLNLPDTTAKTFKAHQHKMPELFGHLLAYKELQKSVSTYGHNWLQHVDENNSVHASFNQLGTDTGRYSCDSPNLQNIPIRKDGRYRNAFIARDGYKLVTADLKQIEYKLAGEFAEEESIITEYNRSKPDFHQLTANIISKILSRNIDRATGKKINFSLLYQAGPGKLVEELGCNMAEAKIIYKAFWSGYSNLRSYMFNMGYQAIARGYSETKLGRRRYFNVASNTPSWEIDRMQREGGNMPVQGCLPSDSFILCKCGWIRLGNFIEGNVWTGANWAFATKLYKGKAARLRLHLSDGRSFDCDDRHYLLVQDSVWPRWESVNSIIGLPLVRDTNVDFGQSDNNSADDWYWVGRMIGDGYLSNYGWGISFGKLEQDDANKLILWLSSKNLKGKTSSKLGYYYDVDSTGNIKVRGNTEKGRLFWESFGLHRCWGAREKRIPSEVFGLDYSRRAAFILGYFDADGYSRNRSSKFTSCNRLLLEDTLRLLQTVNLTGSIGKKQSNGHSSWYDLYVHKLSKPLYVVSVEPVGYEDMYTLSVNDDRHAFSSEGLISKNSAADILKISTLQMFDDLINYNARLVNQVHDELIVETPIDATNEVAEIIRSSMISAGSKVLEQIPTEVDININTYWSK